MYVERPLLDEVIWNYIIVRTLEKSLTNALFAQHPLLRDLIWWVITLHNIRPQVKSHLSVANVVCGFLKKAILCLIFGAVTMLRCVGDVGVFPPGPPPDTSERAVGTNCCLA